MPHLTLEYSDNLTDFDPRQALGRLNEALVASGQFEEVDIKSRAVRLDTFVVGTQPSGRAFVHAKLALLSGRTEDTRCALSQRLLSSLQALRMGPPDLQVQLCVEVLEIERASYAKATIDPV